MATLELAQPVQGVSLRSLVVQMEVAEEKQFPMEYDQAVRSDISRAIKFKYPDRKYKTHTKDKVEGVTVLTVIRIN
jgi:hypothetical protein